MKRTAAKHHRFGPGEFAGLAKQCMDAIAKGDDLFALLASKGIDDPVNEWYDIRRWIKSNDPGMYAQIPMNLRLELPAHPAGTPVQRVNTKVETKETKETSPETKETSQKEAETPAAEPKRRIGRPPRAKIEEEPVREKRPRKAPQKPKAKVVINEVQGQKLTYTRHENGTIFIHFPGFADSLTLRIDEIRTMMSELPEVVKILGK